MPGNPTLKKRSLCDLVCEEIQREILRGQYKPGDRLPSEDRLCEIYSVGRGSVREALKRLEIVGLINIVHGRGVEVAEGNSVERRLRVLETNLILSGAELTDMIEVRCIIEKASVTRIVNEAAEVPEQLGSLLDSYVGGAMSMGFGGELTDRFLAAIVESSGNSALYVIYDSICNLILDGYRHRRRSDIPVSGELSECRQLLAALENNDESRALAALNRIHGLFGGSLVPEEAGT